MITSGFLTVSTGLRVAAVSAATGGAHDNTNLELVLGILLFVAAGFAIVLGGLLIGKMARPAQPHPEKGATYECGEPAIGGSWVQFDIRFYTVALVFIVFDVEVALLWPWAVTFKELGAPAFWAFLVFFSLIAIPFLYEWKSGYLNWVRACTGQRRAPMMSGAGGEAPARDEHEGSAAVARTTPEPLAVGAER